MSLFSTVNLDALKLIDALASSPTLTAASQRLFLTPSAVSQRLDKLEAQLRFRVVRRAHWGIELTEAGEVLAKEVRQALTGLEIACVSARRIDRNRESAAIMVPPTLAKFWLFPRLPDFYTNFPGIDLEFVTSDTLVKKPAAVDITIRYDQAITRAAGPVLFRDHVIPTAAKSYLQDQSIPTDPNNLEWLRDATLLLSEPCLVNWKHWLSAQSAADVLSNARQIRFGNCMLSLEAACSGMGFSMTSYVYTEYLYKRDRMVSPSKFAVRLDSGWTATVDSTRLRENRTTECVWGWLEDQAHNTRESLDVVID